MIQEKLYKKLRIFVACPGDVMKERDRVDLVVREFNQSGGIADDLGLTLEVLDWRGHVFPSLGRPEEVILDQLSVGVCSERMPSQRVLFHTSLA